MQIQRKRIMAIAGLILVVIVAGGISATLAMAGGGVRGGVVHGRSDKRGAFPEGGVVRPKDLAATIFHLLGYDPHTTVPDPLNRPISLSRGKVIQSLI